MVSLLRWQGRYRTADWVRQNCGDGEWPDDMAQRLDEANIRYAYVTNGDVKFLEWACRTRRGCGITVMGGGAHGRLGPSRRQVGRPLGQQRRREIHLGSARDADCRVEGERRVGRHSDLHSGGSASTITSKSISQERKAMNKLLLCVLCVVALFAAVVPCFADTVNGVLAEERVVNLPNDQDKWYISVVGRCRTTPATTKSWAGSTATRVWSS